MSETKRSDGSVVFYSKGPISANFDRMNKSGDSGKSPAAVQEASNTDARNVVEFIVYGQDVVMKSGAKMSETKKIRGIRKQITQLTKASIKRLKLHLRNVKAGYNQFLTLTYPGIPTDGREVKYHWQRMRQWLQKNGVSDGTWFMEFQKRGSPHFHAVIKGNDSITPRRVAAAWCRIIKEPLNSNCFKVHAGTAKGGKPCVEPIRKPHAISYYATKYATKPEQKEVPEQYQNVGRFWGVWGSLRPEKTHIWGRGFNAVNAARELLREWRVFWKTEAGVRLTETDLKLRNSGTLWGGGEYLGDLMHSVQWYPN